MQLRVESQLYEWLPGGMVLLPAQALRGHTEWNTLQSSEFLWWAFQYQVGNTFDILRLFDHSALFFLKEPQAFERVFLQHLALFRDRQPDKPAQLVLEQARALEVMAHLLDSLPWSDAPAGGLSDIPPAFYEILQQILRAPEDGVQLKALARQYHMHPTYISNRFKYHFGVTPAQLCRHLSGKRLCKACAADRCGCTHLRRRDARYRQRRRRASAAPGRKMLVHFHGDMVSGGHRDGRAGDRCGYALPGIYKRGRRRREKPPFERCDRYVDP